MSISSLGSSTSVSQTQYLGRQRQNFDADGGSQSINGGESRFANAISQALASLSASPSTSSTSSSSSSSTS